MPQRNLISKNLKMLPLIEEENKSDIQEEKKLITIKYIGKFKTMIISLEKI